MTAAPHVLVVEPESAGQRLDVFLTSHLENTSRARVQQLISQGKVLVNRRQEKASFKLRGSEQIEIMDEVTREPLRAYAEEIPLEIVYEDKDLAVIKKTTGEVLGIQGALSGLSVPDAAAGMSGGSQPLSIGGKC